MFNPSVKKSIFFFFRLDLKWYDSRLTFLNLKSSNNVGIEMRDKIWIPKLIFCNSDKEYQVQNDDFSTLTVEKMGKFSMFTIHCTIFCLHLALQK